MTKSKVLLLCLISSVAFTVACGGGDSESTANTGAPSPLGMAGDGQLAAKLDSIRSTHGVPALAAFLINDKSLIEMAAIGLRATDTDVEVTDADQWHIGSITKSMTATLAGVMVDEGLLTWDSTLLDIFPEWQGDILPRYETLTLTQLLSHTSGLEDEFQHPVLEALDWTQAPDTQRRQASQRVLSYDHQHAAGEFIYANTNYVIAGAMLEKVSHALWPDLLEQKVFAPLGITGFGFGPPGTEGAVDQPLGHRLEAGQYTSVYDDNKTILDPAGRVHIDLDSMMTYARLHLQGLRGDGNFLSADSYQQLYTSYSNSNYGLGFGVLNGVLEHRGSNTLWLAAIVINGKSNRAYFVVTNAASDAANLAIIETINVLQKRADNAGN